MFTGLIEKTGIIKTIKRTGSGLDILIEAGINFSSSIKKGDSISIDGCCLTCEEVFRDSFKVHALKESADKTIIPEYKMNRSVNLEKSVPANGRFGGHFVNGHVDTAGRVEFIKKDRNKTNIRISVSGKIGKYLVENDSIAVNGVSLTKKSLY